MKISDYSPLKGYGGIKKKAGTGSGSVTFADVLSDAESSSAAAPSAAASAAMPLGGLIGLQEVSDEEYQRKKQIQSANNILNSLESLRHSLLMGRVPIDVLRTLESRLKQQRMLTIDPALHELMDDIELRAAVELAKFETAFNQHQDLV